MDKKEKKIRVHKYWMAFRREYHKVKEGHKPKITHEEVEEIIYQIMSQVNAKNLKTSHNGSSKKDCEECHIPMKPVNNLPHILFCPNCGLRADSPE